MGVTVTRLPHYIISPFCEHITDIGIWDLPAPA